MCLTWEALQIPCHRAGLKPAGTQSNPFSAIHTPRQDKALGGHRPQAILPGSEESQCRRLSRTDTGGVLSPTRFHMGVGGSNTRQREKGRCQLCVSVLASSWFCVPAPRVLSWTWSSSLTPHFQLSAQRRLCAAVRLPQVGVSLIWPWPRGRVS